MLNEVPAQAVAHSSKSDFTAQPVILPDMLVVAGGPDEVEANAVPPPVRRAFETGHQEAVKNHLFPPQGILVQRSETPQSHLKLRFRSDSPLLSHNSP